MKPDPEPETVDEVSTIEAIDRRRIVVLMYDPSIDEVEIDDKGCSPLETRGILADAFSRMFPQAVEP